MSLRQGWLESLSRQSHQLGDGIWHMECACKSPINDKSFEAIRLAKLKVIELQRLLDEARDYEMIEVRGENNVIQE